MGVLLVVMFIVFVAIGVPISFALGLGVVSLPVSHLWDRFRI